MTTCTRITANWIIGKTTCKWSKWTSLSLCLISSLDSTTLKKTPSTKIITMISIRKSNNNLTIENLWEVARWVMENQKERKILKRVVSKRVIIDKTIEKRGNKLMTLTSAPEAELSFCNKELFWRIT